MCGIFLFLSMDRTVAPLINPLSDFQLQEAKHQVLDNGVNVYTIDQGEQPLIRLEVVFEAGTKYETKPGVSFIASKMLQEGTESYTAADIQESIAALGAFIEVQHGAERINLTFYLLTKYINRFLPILKEIMTKATFPEENFGNVINIASNNIKVNLQKNSVLASQEFKKLLFGEKHHYGYSVQESDLSVITLNDVTHHYQKYIKKSDFEVFISGAIDKNSSNILTEFFSEFKVDITKPILKNSFEIVPNREILVKKEDALQSSIRIGKVMFNRSHADYFKTLISNEILGGYFGSRLMKNIREEKGLTYGISSQLVSLEDSGYFIIGTDVKKEYTRLALDEIYKEIALLSTELVSEHELETVTSYMHGSYLGSINSAFALMDKFKTLHYSGMDYSYYTRYIQTLKTITVEEVKAYSAKYFKDLNEVVVGNYE